MSLTQERRLEAIEAPPKGWISVAELTHDPLDKISAARLLGKVGVQATFEVCEEPSEFPDLCSAIQAASHGNEKAREVVAINVSTDLIERMYKQGIVLKVPMSVGVDNKFHQGGQSMSDVHRNAYAYMQHDPLMRGRTVVEARNTLRSESAIELGLLDTKSFVVFSLVPTEASIEDVKARKFFTNTMTLTIQRLSKTAEGEYELESAFVAGVLEPEADRHDVDAIVRMAAAFGVNLWGKSATEILDSPQLIDNSLTPNGVVDIVQMYDRAVSELNGGIEVFFGAAQVGDYEEVLAASQEKIDKIQPTVDEVVEALIQRAETLRSAEEARDLLDALNHQKLLEISLKNHSVDPILFGSQAASKIEEARRYDRAGDFQRAQRVMLEALEVAKPTSSCPTALKNALERSAKNSENSGDEVDSSMSGTMYCVKCPKCREPHDEVKKQADGKYYCNNPSCELAHPSTKIVGREKKTKVPATDFAAEIRKGLFKLTPTKKSKERKPIGDLSARTPALH